MKQGKSSKSEKSGHKNRTIFLGGIPLDTNKQELREFIQQYDQVDFIELAKDQSRKACKGFAKAVLRTEKGIQRLLSAGPHTIRGLTIGIKKWSRKADYLREKDEVSKRKLYVRYHPSYSREDLVLHFSLFGQIESIDIKTDPWTNKPRNFAYIIFQTEDQAVHASKNCIVADKSQYIYCELTTPSYLMQPDAGTTLCASPTLKNLQSPFCPTKLESFQSFEPSMAFVPKYGSMNNLESYANQSIKSSRELPKNSKYCSVRFKGQVGSSQALFNIEEAQVKPRRRPATCNELASAKSELFHESKPTTKLYRWHRVSSNHYEDNLFFTKNDLVFTF